MVTNCNVKSIEALTSDTFRILLCPEQAISFKAGQYLMVIMGDKDKRPFSIASCPSRNNGSEIELHIGAEENNSYACEVVELMRAALAENKTITVDVPHGEAWIREDTSRPLLLIAGGTGFSYTYSILEHCLSQCIDRTIYLYWGARGKEQLYARMELEKIASQHKSVTFVPAIEQGEEWNGKIGNVLDAVKEDFSTLNELDIYIAGRFEMADIARKQFVSEKGALEDRIFGDAFAFL